MVVANGVLQVKNIEEMSEVIKELQERNIEIEDAEDLKIDFMMERDTVRDVKSEVESLKKVDNVDGVHISYYTVEGNGEE